MTENKTMARTYSQDRQTYRNNSISVTRKRSIQYSRTSENYYSNRNCPEILSLFALTNRRLDNRKNEIYHSYSNDTHYFNMINYPIQSPPRTPILKPQSEIEPTETPKFPKVTSKLNHASENDDKHTKFPTVTPRRTTATTKKFPTLTPRNTPSVQNKTSVQPTKSPIKPSTTQTKMPIVSTGKAKKKI